MAGTEFNREGTPGTEQRKIKRWQLIYYLRVFDQETDALLGHAVDISTDGLKVVSEWPIPTQKTYQLWMEVPSADGESRKVVLQVYSLWSKPEEKDEFYSTGFRLLNPSTSMTESIRRLTNQL